MTLIFVSVILIAAFMCGNDEPSPWSYWLLEFALCLLLFAIAVWPR